MPAYSNRLIKETSPYLLQHAHNPVDWYPWCDEAFEKAKTEDKPVLISIGYAACHWCHVMEKESFENEETAKLMNEYFINIKVDREERPDIDHVYMDALQAMTGSGGWPLNMFLTPAAKPFFGGTYFPPARAYNRSSWPEIIVAIHNAYKNKKNEIESQAENLTDHLKNANPFVREITSFDSNDWSPETLETISKNMLSAGDKTWGGFGNAPKFPQTGVIQFLLRQYHFYKDEDALAQALLSLDKMIMGGIYDQLGGGFSRYSTDEKWMAPHFEKMLYDNALLISVVSEAYQLTRKQIYLDTIHHSMNFIQNELMNDEGAFFSALDADSEGVEGKFYTWSKEEITLILGTDAEWFCKYYNVTENGNWEHTNILWQTKLMADFLAENKLNMDQFSVQIKEARSLLLLNRNKRIRPLLDDKIILSWNALMNIACSKAFAATGFEKYRHLAIRNMHFIEQSFFDQRLNTIHHTYKNGEAKHPAFLDDYAFLIQAYIHLQEITSDQEYLNKAASLVNIVCTHFNDQTSSFFYFTAHHQKDIIVRKIELYDGATPSANSTMAINLHYLGIVFNNKEWVNQAEQMLMQLNKAIVRYSTSFAYWANFMQMKIKGMVEISVTGNAVEKVLSEILQEYIPAKILQSSNEEDASFPLLKEKNYGCGATIYVCKDYSCKKPVDSMKDLKNLLK